MSEVRMRIVISVLTVALLFGGAAYGEWPTLPQGLAAWYKPQHERQMWLHTMFSLRREMQAVEEYAAAGEFAQAISWGERFAKHYRSLGKMVPEWQQELELGALERMELALREEERSALAAALRRLQVSCRSCHRDVRALAAARFRAPDFRGMELESDQGGKWAYQPAMEQLSRTVNRVNIALVDERWPQAEVALGDLRRQLHHLGEGCTACHTDSPPRERILGATLEQQWEQLAEAIHAQQVEQATRTLGAAAVASCARCHAVHRTLSDLREWLE